MIEFVLLLAAALPTGAGETLPPLKGEYLSGRKATLPDDARGKVSLLAIGFSYDSRFAVEEWVKSFRKDFGSNSGVTFYEIPMIGGMARMGKWFIDSGMRRGTPKADHEHVITVYGGVDPWKKRLQFGKDDEAYLVLLDTQGRMVWQHHGKFDPGVYTKLAATVTGLLGR